MRDACPTRREVYCQSSPLALLIRCAIPTMPMYRPVRFSAAGPPTMGYLAPSPLCITIKPVSLPRVRCQYSQCLIHVVAPRPLTLGAPFATCCDTQAPYSVGQPPPLRHLSDHLGPPWILSSIHVRAAASSAHPSTLDPTSLVGGLAPTVTS
jgi:hypothetical protein